MKITGVRVRDIRFPTSRNLDRLGCAQRRRLLRHLRDRGDGRRDLRARPDLHQRTGNELTVAAVRALQHHVIGLSLEEIKSDMRGLYPEADRRSPAPLLGPEKGILHMATGALLNAIWDLWAKAERKPLWKLLVDLTRGAARLHHRPELPLRRPDRGAGARAPAQAAADARGARGGDARARLPRLHDLDGLARVLRREGAPAVRGSGGRGLDASQDEGRAGPGDEPASGRPHPQHHRLPEQADDGCEPCWDVPEAIRQMHSLAEFDPWWIEEAHLARRRARACRHRARGRAHPVATARPARTASSSSSSCRRARSGSARSTAAASAA